MYIFLGSETSPSAISADHPHNLRRNVSDIYSLPPARLQCWNFKLLTLHCPYCMGKSWIKVLGKNLNTDVLWLIHLLGRPKVQYFRCQLHKENSKIIECCVQRKLIITANKFMQKKVNYLTMVSNYEEQSIFNFFKNLIFRSEENFLEIELIFCRFFICEYN